MRTQEITFRVGVKHGKKQTVKFKILHNLSESGLDLDDQFEKWLLSNPEDPANPYEFCSFILTNNKTDRILTARPIKEI